MPSARKANVVAPDSVPRSAWDKLSAFEALVRRWNARAGLVSRADVHRLRERHTEDGLSLLPWVDGRLADVGSGAGFPGIPLAIARPETPVVLIERSARKCAFLRQAVIDLDLANIDVAASDARDYAPASFDIVTVRAVAPPPQAWRLIRHLLAPTGKALLQSHERMCSPAFPGGEVLEEAAAGRGWVTVVGLD